MSERTLAAECLAAITLTALGSAVERKAAPNPRELAAVTVCYFALAGAAMFGPNAAQVASGVGALVLLGITVGGAGHYLLAGLEHVAGATSAIPPNTGAGSVPRTVTL